MRFGLVFSLGLAASLLAGTAISDAPARPLARLLGKSMATNAKGRVPMLTRIPKGADAKALGLFEVAPGIGSIALAPDAIEGFSAAHPELRLVWSPPRRALLDVSKKWTKVDTFRNATGATGKGVIVGIIDTGIDVRHPDFLDANGKSRIRWLLNSGAPQGIHADLESEYGCTDPSMNACAIFTNTDIDALVAENKIDSTDPEGHGTHVSSIAAGNGGISKTKTPKYVGVAPEATLIVAAPSPGGGFFDPDILRAAKFIFDQADALGMPCVVNLSVGGDFGPHDGTSLLEQGLSAFVGDDKPGHAIVVAAGNSGTLYQVDGGGPFGIHTEAHVAPNTDVRVPILAGQSTTGQGYAWITFNQGDDVSVSLEGPNGKTWVGFTSPGTDQGYTDGDDTGGVINAEVSDNSPIDPGTNSAVVTFSGPWDDHSEFAVHLEGSGDAQLWLTGTGDVGPTSPIGVLFERALRQGTINEPATAPSLLAVGCTINRLEWTPLGSPTLELTSLGGVQNPPLDSLCYFSAAGPTPAGVMKPELVAPGGFVAAAMSSGADPRVNPGGLFDQPGCPDAGKCYVVDDFHAITVGTSMSSPHVAGAVALLMQLDPTLTQARVTEVLQAGAHFPEGGADNDQQLGPGELDLEGARMALATDTGSGSAPDLAMSWYSLGSGYVRPTSSWPVDGVIELRRADGSVATGLDGTALALHVDNGVVLQSITKVRQGLFTFAIGGTPGTGGGELTLDVTYGGMSLGASTLPIGLDAWAAEGGVDATSAACSCRAAGSSSNDEGALAFAAIAALFVSRRKGSRAERPRCRSRRLDRRRSCTR